MSACDFLIDVLCLTVVEKPEGKKQPTDIEAGEKFGVRQFLSATNYFLNKNYFVKTSSKGNEYTLNRDSSIKLFCLSSEKGSILNGKKFLCLTKVFYFFIFLFFFFYFLFFYFFSYPIYCTI